MAKLMKGRLLSVAAGLTTLGVLALPAHADEDVASLPENLKLYGKANISLQHDFDYDYVSKNVYHNEYHTKLHSNASRVGAKGKYALNDDVSLIYKAEYEVDANDGYGKQKDFFNMREVYAGISSKKFGTVEGGKLDTPLKMLQSKVDLFSDLTAADIKNIMPGKNRESFSYIYKTPAFFGLTAALATVDFKRLDNASSKSVDQQGSSISLTYASKKLLTDSDSLYLAVARDNGVKDLDINRIAAQYKWSDFTVGALAQTSHKRLNNKTFPTGSRDENGYIINAAWNFMPNDTVKIQWGRSQEVEYGGSLLAVGYDHKINKDLKLYVYHGYIGGNEVLGAKADRTLASNGVGLEYTF